MSKPQAARSLLCQHEEAKLANVKTFIAFSQENTTSIRGCLKPLGRMRARAHSADGRIGVSTRHGWSCIYPAALSDGRSASYRVMECSLRYDGPPREPCCATMRKF